MSEDAIETWATALAGDALPGEVDLATELASAYVAGGRRRQELFTVSGSAAGGFDVGGLVAVLPLVLSAIAAAGGLLLNVLGSGLLSLPGTANDVIDLWERRRAKPAPMDGARPPAGTGSPPPGSAELAALDQLCSALETELRRAGIKAEQRQLLAYRVVRRIARDPDGTRAFLAAIGQG